MSKRKRKEAFDKSQKAPTLEELNTACFLGSIDYVKRAINEGININSISEDGRTPLTMACYGGKFDVVKELIKAGADVEMPDYFRETALYCACASGRVDIAKELITNHHANIETINAKGYHALYIACLYGRIDIVRLLIDFNISFEGNAYEDKAIKHYFPFDVACDLDHEDIVKELVNRVSLTTIKRNLRVGQKFKVTKLLQERMHQEYLPKMLLLILGQQQPNSPLSMLHHNLLQDIQKVIKEKYFL